MITYICWLISYSFDRKYDFETCSCSINAKQITTKITVSMTSRHHHLTSRLKKKTILSNDVDLSHHYVKSLKPQVDGS